MKSLLLLILLISFSIGWSQTPNNCGNYTSTGSSSASGYADPNAACGANVPGTITGGTAAWTGSSCSGQVISTVTGPAVSCLTVSYGAVNTDDYGTITTNTGGTLTITAVNAAVNGNVVGPFNCGSGYYGNVMVTICSTVPFTQLILTNTGCSSGWVINCVSTNCAMNNLTANVGACVPPGVYSTSGQVAFTSPPSSGQLIVEDCNGNQQTFNAPFTSPINYNITGQLANGTPCDITAYFTADPACTINIGYNAPQCVCNIDVFNANIGLCDQLTDTYGISGDVSFTSPPGSGTLIVEVNNGTTIYDTIINMPFSSPQTWSISGIPSNGANSSVTVYFSSDPGCSSTINYTAPTSCACNADIGTFTANITGSSNNNYVLCFGDQIDLNSNNDWTGPGEMFNPPGPPYTPGVSWLMYSCPPTVALTPDPNNTVPSDPCFIGLVSNTNFSDVNDLFWINSYPPGTFTNNTIYWVPITMYSQANGTYSFVNGTIPCYELGTPFAVQYLPQFTSSSTDDCLAGTATVTLNGGLPAIDGSNFTASNLQPATASFGNTTATNGGTITINGLQGGDMWSFDVDDGNGCPYTVTGGPFTPLENPGFNYPQSSWCTSEAPVSPTITGVPGGTFTSSPAGLTINAANGQITPATSTPGTYDITYTTPGACFNDSTITINIASTPSVNPVADQVICDGANFTAVTFTGSTGSSFNWTNSNTTIGLAASGSGNIASFTGSATAVQQQGTITVTPSAGSCVGTPINFVLTVNPSEDPSFTYLASAWCTSDGVQAATINGTPGGTFSVVPAGLSLNTTSGAITPATSTPGTYDVTYTTPGPCTQTSTVAVAINPVPNVNPIADETVCVGSNFTAINFTGSIAGTTFSWTNDNTATGLAASGNGNIAAFAGQTTGGTIASVITVTPATTTCTGPTESFTLTVNDLDDPSFSYTPGLTYCQSAADPITNLTGLNGGTFSYAVVSGGPTLDINPTTGDIVLATSDVGVYDITYNTTGAVGSLCPNTFTLQLVITPAPVADFTLDIYCANNTDPLPTYQNGGSGGTFSSTPGLSINPNTGQVDLSASTPGSYNVTNSINVPGCLLATAVDDIIIYEVPTASISGSADICSGDPLPNLTIDITAGTPAWDVTYNLNGSPTTINTTATPYTIIGAGVGTYDLVSITDGNGCQNTINGQAIVNEFQTPIMNPLNDQYICEDNLLAVQTFSSVPAGTTFGWNVTNGTNVGFGLSGAGDIGSFIGVNGTGLSVQAAIEVIPTSIDGCVGAPETFTITVFPNPVVSFTGSAAGCEPLNVEFTNTTTPSGTNCIWDFGDGNVANGCGTVYNNYAAGTFDVSLYVTTANGCSGSATYPGFITVAPRPHAAFSFAPQTIDIMNTEVQFNNNSTNASSYQWSFGDDSPFSTNEDPTHFFPDEPGHYTVELIAYDANSWCPDITSQVVVVNDVVIFYVPNVFTPDGDEFNESFQPVFTSGFDPFDYHLTIFNRWGETIFESFNALKGWNGHYGDGGLVDDGVYIWQIDFKENMTDKRHIHRGHVTVLK